MRRLIIYGLLGLAGLLLLAALLLDSFWLGAVAVFLGLLGGVIFLGRPASRKSGKVRRKERDEDDGPVDLDIVDDAFNSTVQHEHTAGSGLHEVTHSSDPAFHDIGHDAGSLFDGADSLFD